MIMMMNTDQQDKAKKVERERERERDDDDESSERRGRHSIYRTPIEQKPPIPMRHAHHTHTRTKHRPTRHQHIHHDLTLLCSILPLLSLPAHKSTNRTLRTIMHSLIHSFTHAQVCQDTPSRTHARTHAFKHTPTHIGRDTTLMDTILSHSRHNDPLQHAHSGQSPSRRILYVPTMTIIPFKLTTTNKQRNEQTNHHK